MGVKKKPTLKILFRQFAISLIVMLVAAIIVPFGLEGLAVNAGLATRANLSELQVKDSNADDCPGYYKGYDSTGMRLLNSGQEL